MNASLTITVIVVLLVHQSLQDNVLVDCDSKFYCKIFNINNSSELIKLKEKISSGSYVNADGTQINISQIIKITFLQSTFKELPDGIFNEAIFASLKTINLAGVGLQKINLDGFNLIELLDISNNELTSIEISGDLKKTKIEFINLKKNYWDCSYLSKLLQILSERGVKHTEVTQHDIHGCNILGIECFCSIGNQIDMKINEIFKAFKAQDPFHELFLNSFDNMQPKFLEIDTKVNKTYFKMHSTLLSMQNIGNTCNETAVKQLLIDKYEENMEERMQLSENIYVEEDIVLNLNTLGQTLKVVRMNLTTKVDELAAIVTKRWSIVPLSSPKEPITSKLWLWIVIILIVLALITYLCIYHRISISSVFKMLR